MTTFRRSLSAFLAACTALLLAACGGGGGGSSDGGGNNGGGTGGIDRGGITFASGPITGFGSVHVNGVHFSTTGATFTVDDHPGLESDLRVGQVVRIEGTVDAGGTTGTATKVIFDDEVEGPVQSVDLAASSLVVLGRLVRVGPGTSFDDRIVPRSLDGLAVGERIEVSGLVSADGSVDATRIELKTGVTGDFEVKGAVASLDTVARRFSLGTQVVSYATATLSGFTSGQPANGDRVEARGLVDAGGVLVATAVKRDDGGFDGGTDDHADVEGLIDRFVSATDFSVAGHKVTTTASTTFSGGGAASLALNVAVEVEGGFDATGTIVATKVEFRRDGDRELDGQVDAVNVAGNTLTVLGTLVRVNALTRFEDHSSSDVTRFSLANIAVGDYVEVEAYDDGAGLLATRIERDDTTSEVRLEGVAQDVVAPNFTVNGVAITTNAATEFRDKNGATVGASAFFAVASGQRVKVRGSQVGGVVVAQRAELEH